ncbi:MAG: acyl-CoA/acyl-ACP dehydrogenase [SAR86 cluster bacterium]|jgi:alkylation response protein AidB-like acyl-CoA dehydrogenase|nr:acyl-CoA/acyl-ACP dehydrogenase [SAR86 cluster bacterium]MDA9964549.1 acyl-CoA/acyl-ACP dehydrogenase [Gammaproteobacteria bacterium]MDB2370677.1 acyl-CoA/acyl-ACP dehydrogenase [Gammaproteobacteria bacterium]
MDFSEQSHQTEVRASLDKILREHCSQECLKEYDSNFKHDENLLSLLSSNGYLGLGLNEKYGGSGEDLYDLGILFEQLGYHAAPLSLSGCLVDVAQTIQKFGNEKSCKDILGSIIAGEIYTSAILEPSNQDPENPITTAKIENDQLIISGTKYLSEISSMAKSILISVNSSEGVLLVLVESDKVQLTELSSTANSPLFKVELDSIKVSRESIIHEPGRGLEALRYLIQINMVMRSYIALGVTEKMTSLVAGYTSEREQFGRVIGTFQAVSHRAADCFIELECLRLVNQQASINLNTNLDCENDALVSKIWAGNTCHKISYSAQHLHGGMGVDKDYVLWRYCLLAKECELINGSASQNIDRLGINLTTNQ